MSVLMFILILFEAVIAEALQHPNNLGQYFAGLISRVFFFFLKVYLGSFLTAVAIINSSLCPGMENTLSFPGLQQLQMHLNMIRIHVLSSKAKFYFPVCFPVFYMIPKSTIISNFHVSMH